jgi:hypothetical protein
LGLSLSYPVPPRRYRRIDEQQRRERELDAPELIAAEPEKPRVLKDRELGVSLEYDRDGGYWYVPNVEE